MKIVLKHFSELIKRYFLLTFGIVLIGCLTGCLLKKNHDPLLESDYLNHDIEYRRPEDQDCLRVLVQILEAVDHKDNVAL
ncbi:MAG: hypothetical protein PUC65_14125 [Clostridiales bacterium]|nr:hypothetical protein [Clostridiales bacterium]